MDNLRILLQAGINQGKSISSLNEQIKALSKHPSLQKIKLKIDIDKNFTQSINSFITATNKLKKISDDQSKVVREEVEQYKKLDGSIETVTKTVLKNGEVIQKSKRIHDENRRAMQDETIAAKKLAESVEKQNKVDLDSIAVLRNKANAIKGFKVTSSQGYTVTSQRLEADGQTLVGSTSITNYKKQRSDQLREQERLNKESEALDRAHFNAIRDNNKRIEDMEKLHYLALQQNAKRNLDYQQSVADRQAKINDLQRRYGSDRNVSQSLSSLNSALNNISSVGSFRNGLRDIDTQLRNITASATTARSSAIGFREAFATAMQKFPVWINLCPLCQ